MRDADDHGDLGLDSRECQGDPVAPDRPNNSGTLRPLTYTPAQNGITAGGNGTGAVLLTVCNASGIDFPSPAMTFDFIALTE